MSRRHIGVRGDGHQRCRVGRLVRYCHLAVFRLPAIGRISGWGAGVADRCLVRRHLAAGWILWWFEYGVPVLDGDGPLITAGVFVGFD